MDLPILTSSLFDMGVLNVTMDRCRFHSYSISIATYIKQCLTICLP